MIYYIGKNDRLERSYFYQKCSLEHALDCLKTLDFIGLDTETSGLDCHSKVLLTIQLGNAQDQFVFDIKSFDCNIPQILKDFLNNFDGTFILQNAKFDLQFLYKQDVIIKHIYDTMLAETILTIGLQKDGRDLQTLVQKYCNERLDKSVRGQIITKGLSEEVIVYGARDVQFLEHIMNVQKNYAESMKLTGAVNLDNEFVKCLAYIEYCGIKLDWPKWEEKSLKDLEELNLARKKMETWLWDNGYQHYFSAYNLFSDRPECVINWNSEQQVIPLLEEIGINCTIKKKGMEKKTVEKKALQFQIKDFPFLKLYYDYSAQQKLVSTYGMNWKSMINPVTGRIHTSYKQIMNTGRLSSGESKRNLPNLQNLPNDALTRSCFIANSENKFIAVDFSSQESIVLANFAQDKSLINFYQKGLKDMHSYVAFLLFPEIQKDLGKTSEEITNDDLIYIKKQYHNLRQIAKTAEFAISYGGNGSTIAKNTGCSKEQGNKVYDSYFQSFSGLKNYFDRMFGNTVRNSYILYNNITGRKFFIDHNNPVIKYQDEILQGLTYHEWEYNKAAAEIQRLSQNYPIQGSSADCSKLAGCIFFNQILKNGWFNKVLIVNMVHDEYCVEAPNEIADEVANTLFKSMVKAGTYFCKTIPLSADAEIGSYWIH